ncbi:unnamed protein product [Polarella glacialis]|uniref:Anaphase-promoting complex subunit 6 n=1 Tax=Polarella glacialis TaxID=89957 RepID=A0A813G8A1_POLGL|nr:unnamed protein product [Polarella glacialis]
MGSTYDQPTIDSICCRLRKLVQDSFQKHLYTTAIFFADKLVSLSHEAEDLYTLAECYFKNREYRRVLHLLKKHNDITGGDERLKLLAAQSLMECRDWDECIRYLDDNAPADDSPSDPKMASVFALLRGKVYEVTENQENALLWYERAVQLDPYCHEALDRLVGNHLLTLEREVALLRSLRLHKEDEWLRHLYAAKLAAARSSSENPLEPASQTAQGTSTSTASATATSQEGVSSVQDGSATGGDTWWGIGRQRRLHQAREGLDSLKQDKYPAQLLPAALAQNGHTLAAQSTRYFYQGDFESCYLVSKKVLEDDPYHLATLPVHIASLVMLDMKNVVFYVAHQLVNAYPAAPVAWFTAGCYYYMIKKYEHARRFFHKALSLDHNFAPAWIAYGHAFAHHDESDQALAAYRTASRLFPGSQLPWLFIGMEYVRTNSLQLALQCLECARSLMPTDPHIYNEIGVVAFHKKAYSKAVDLLNQALRWSTTPHETTCSNLGHALLKCGAYDRALEAFQQANRLNPRSASVLSGIAFTLQLQGKPDEAIEYYHRALSIQRDDAFASEMLSYAVQETGENDSSMEL